MSAGVGATLHAGGLERGALLLGRALAARDDGARVAHALAGGAVAPAMNAATGFFMFALMYAAARSSALPPISPIMMTPCVSGSALKSLSTSTKSMPPTGSPPMPTHVDWPMPSAVSWPTAS